MHGELAKLGISISQAAVSKYMVRHRTPPSHTWRSFLDNHANDLVSLDFFTLPTATFSVLFVFIVLRHERRRIVHFNVTEHPSAECQPRERLPEAASHPRRSTWGGSNWGTRKRASDYLQ